MARSDKTAPQTAPQTERPLLLMFGCSDLARPLRVRGLNCSAVRSLRQLQAPKEGLRARAIILGEPGLKGVQVREVVSSLRKAWPLVDIIVWAPRGTAKLVRDALRGGARDVLLSHSIDRTGEMIQEIIEAQQLLPRAARMGPQEAQPSTFEGMISRSARMWDLFDTASRVATTDATVLILGETGTGKELLARAIHRRSGRSGRFVAINCAAVPESLIDSELFGHVKGAFTGAVAEKEGLFRHANGGTLMLDEIGNVPLTVQYRLLRALQEGAVRPVGGHQEIQADVRVIAATSTALEDDVQRGRFREDLFYRLDVIRLELPPLRARAEDILYLFGHFARRYGEQYNVTRPDVSDEFLNLLIGYGWPGNVRQLENLTERLVLTHASRRVTATHLKRLLPFKRRDGRSEPTKAQPARVVTDPAIDTRKTLEENLTPQIAQLERAYLEACLRENQGRIERTAQSAGISRRTLLRKLKSYGIDKSRYR